MAMHKIKSLTSAIDLLVDNINQITQDTILRIKLKILLQIINEIFCSKYSLKFRKYYLTLNFPISYCENINFDKTLFAEEHIYFSNIESKFLNANLRYAKSENGQRYKNGRRLTGILLF